MKEERFVKVHIKSESDLPKVEDFYAVQRKDGMVEWEVWEPSKDKGYVDKWLNEIDWYLAPIEQPKEVRTAKEFLKQLYRDDKWEPTFDNIVKVMEAYYSQFTGQTALSDEEIDNFYPVTSLYTAMTMRQIDRAKACREGAKWYRDQLKTK